MLVRPQGGSTPNKPRFWPDLGVWLLPRSLGSSWTYTPALRMGWKGHITGEDKSPR